jgi:pimeloyl-ACP methyl ester carboxylesterase
MRIECAARRSAAYLFLAFAALSTAGYAARAESSYARIGPLRMYYEVHGNGRPLLILHGGGSTIRTTFGAILPALAKNHTVIAPEQQGHGHTADVDRPLSFRQMADDTAALVRKLGVGPVDVLGFSNGGSIAMEMAMRHPGLVRRLVVASVYYRRDGIHPELLRSFRTANAADMPEVYRNAYLAVAPDPDALAELTPKLMRNILSFEGWTEANLATIKAPTMILQAGRAHRRPQQGHSRIPARRPAGRARRLSRRGAGRKAGQQACRLYNRHHHGVSGRAVNDAPPLAVVMMNHSAASADTVIEPQILTM